MIRVLVPVAIAFFLTYGMVAASAPPPECPKHYQPFQCPTGWVPTPTVTATPKATTSPTAQPTSVPTPSPTVAPLPPLAEAADVCVDLVGYAPGSVPRPTNWDSLPISLRDPGCGQFVIPTPTPAPAQLAPPAVASPCDVARAQYTGTNAAGVLVACGATPLRPDLPPNLQLPKAGS